MQKNILTKGGQEDRLNAFSEEIQKLRNEEIPL